MDSLFFFGAELPVKIGRTEPNQALQLYEKISANVEPVDDELHGLSLGAKGPLAPSQAKNPPREGRLRTRVTAIIAEIRRLDLKVPFLLLLLGDFLFFPSSSVLCL